MTEPLVSLLTEKCGVDYKNYASSSLSRRLESIVTLQFKGNTSVFTEYVQRADSKEIAELVNSISVNTTEFYRDWGVWKVLISDVLPRLKVYNKIRIWHAGCSTGEEVYSMAILIAEMGLTDKVKIVATDISEKALDRAGKGEYRQKLIEENLENIREIVGLDTFKKYFDIQDEIWKVKREMLPEITYRKKDLSNMTPFSKFDIILCRNVMIYFNLELQNRIIELFSASMFKNGCLVTGKKESAKLVCDIKGFSALNAEERIFAWSDE